MTIQLVADNDGTLTPPSLGVRYALGAVIGAGASGVVHEAWDRRLHRTVAIKRLVRQGTGNEALREARLAVRVRHPAIVAIYEVLEWDGHPAVVMERVRGRTLAEVLWNEPVTEDRAVAWVVAVADALATVHDGGVFHGDIKPSNLMIEADGGRVRILDFGIAHAGDPLATGDAGSIDAGTLAFMSPERLLGHPHNAASDIYALGVVLYALLAGPRATGDQDGLNLAYRKLHDDFPPRLPTASPALQEVIAAMTHRDASRRPTDMRAVIALLRSSLPPAGQPLQDGLPPPPPPHSHATARRGLATRSRWVIAVAVAAAVLGIAIALWWIPPTRVDALPLARLQHELALADQELRAYDDPMALASATQRLNSVLRAHPDHAGAAAALAIAYCLHHAVEPGNDAWLQQAQGAAHRALRGEPQLALAHTAAAWVEEARGRFGEAEQAYKQALALDPAGFQALNGYAQMLITQRRAAEAEDVLQRALAAFPREPAFLNAMGTLRYMDADYSGAERSFNEAIAAKPEAVLSYANLSAALARQGRTDEALSVLQRGLTVRADSRLFTNLGNLLFAQSRYAEAASIFERALAATPGSANSYLKWANLADALRGVPGAEARAQDAYRHALALLGPQLGAAPNATVSSRAGLYAAHMGDCGQAQSLASQALALAPRAPDVLFRAAVAAEVCGERDPARTRLQAAFAAGYPRATAEQEPALRALLEDKRFKQLVSAINQREFP